MGIGAKLFWKMLRPRVAIVLLIFIALGTAQGGYKQQLSWQFFVAALIVATWYINATTINDLADFKIDQINLKGVAERPLANKVVSRKQIMWVSLIAATVALFAGFLLDIRIGILVAACLCLNYLYSAPPIQISYRGALAPLLLPIGYVVLPYLVGTWSVKENITHQGWLILGALYISFIGRIILKDFRDVKGDAKFGKRTFILRYGRAATCLSSALGLIIGTCILLTVIPPQPLIFMTFIALLGCSLLGLYRLYRTHNHTAEQIIIGAIVRSASGAVIILLSLLILQNSSKSLSEQTIVTGTLGLLFIVMFWDTISKIGKL